MRDWEVACYALCRDNLIDRMMADHAVRSPPLIVQLEEHMMRTRGVVAMVAVLALGGCSAMRHDKYCKWALPAWGAALGGAGAGLGVALGDNDSGAPEIGGAAAGGVLV
ncbi:MAG: hypothetical protein E6J81_02105, partial [Deltaproteobacteria bacterium]